MVADAARFAVKAVLAALDEAAYLVGKFEVDLAGMVAMHIVDDEVEERAKTRSRKTIAGQVLLVGMVNE